MVQKFVKIVLCFFIVFAFNVQAQEEGVKSPKYKDYKSDTSFKDFKDLRFKVAKAQINALKNGGALLVRLKTNSKTIEKLRASGNIDLATQLDQETMLANKIIMNSYKLEFKFCPVYFFFSEQSDSVRYKKLDGIFLDSTLSLNPSIVCNANFYVIAESDYIYNSSLGIVNESNASKSIERGSPIRQVPIVIKNRYFIQLHKPFPYFQQNGNFVSPVTPVQNGILIDLMRLNDMYTKISKNSGESRKMKSLRSVVGTFNKRLEKFYNKNAGYTMTSDISEFVY